MFSNNLLKTFLPLYSNYAVLMFDGSGPLIPNQLGPVKHTQTIEDH